MRARVLAHSLIALFAVAGAPPFALGAPAQAAAAEPGVLGHWRFDEGRGDEASDASGNGNDGEIHGATWVRGRFGTALRFGGSNATVTLPPVPGMDGANELTVEAWVLWEGTGRYPNLLSAGAWNPGGLLLFVSDDTCSFRLGKPGDAPHDLGRNWAEASASFGRFELGRWYHLVATIKRPLMQTYVDGKPAHSARWDYPVGISGGLTLGTWWDGKLCHNGLIDDVRILSRALTAEEVRMAYEKEAGRRTLAAGEKAYEAITVPAQPVPPAVTLENASARLTLDSRGRVLGLVEKASKKDLAAKPQTYLVTLKKAGREYRSRACSFRQGRLTVEFPGALGSVVLAVEAKPRWFTFKVLSVSDPEVDEVAFLNLRAQPAKYVSGMAGVASDDASAICLRVLNIQTNASITGKPALMKAIGYRKHGLAGAGAALLVCPRRDLRPAMQALFTAEGVLHSKLGGPWSLDAPENRLSYLFSSVSEKNVDAWIALAKRSGMPIIHLNGFERTLGHYEPRADLFPNGMAGLKAVADKIHAAGLKIGMHTLTGCISPGDPFAAPIPDKRLAKHRTFTLAQPLGEKEDVVALVERPENLDTVWAYASRGNVVQVDDELILFTGYSSEPPYRLTGCRRGAFGTKPAAHAAGAPAGHLFAYYGAFYPDPDSTLVDEVADCIAKVANAGRFDFLYEDGSEGMPGGWYGVARMRSAIYKRIDHPIRIEASEWGYHSWPFHSVIGAWDHPCWALNRFNDLHCQQVEAFKATHLMPGQLGWWAILGPSNDHDAELPEEIEYLCGKALGYGAPLSLMGVGPGQRPPSARQDEYLTTIGRYERLRLAGYFPESVKEKVRTLKEEFRLRQAPGGAWQLFPTDYLARKAAGLGEGPAAWTVTNRHAAQPLRARIQALYSAAPYDSPEGKTLAEFAKPDEFGAPSAASGVTCTFAPSAQEVKAGGTSACLIAENKGKERRGSWARVSKVFPNEVNLGKCAALGVWVHGDGKGEILNFQLTDPPQYYHSAWSDHYVDVDFTGWRYFELPLRERDAERHGDQGWPYGGLYQVYRTSLMREHVSALHLYVNNVPPGETVKVHISPVRALPITRAKMANPALSIAGRSIRFPVSLESGQYLEFESPAQCTLYDERGEALQAVTPEGGAPQLAPGENQVTLSCDAPDGRSPRAKVTLITQGAPLSGGPAKETDWRLLRTECDAPRTIRALDGKQNAWEVICRAPAGKGAAAARDAAGTAGRRAASGQASGGGDAAGAAGRPTAVKAAGARKAGAATGAGQAGLTYLEAEVLVDRCGQAGAAYNGAGSLTVESFDDLARFADTPENRFSQYAWDAEHKGVPAKPGVTHRIERSTEVTKVGGASLRFTATSTRADSAGWCAKGGRFAPTLDLSGYAALGFWIHGDGAGEALKLQLRDTAGAWQDMVTTIEFTGWRYVEFVLGEGARINLAKVEYAILYFNALPGGKTVTCHVDDIRALREPGALRNPSLTVGGRKVVFPVALTTGERLEYQGPAGCAHYARDGSLKGTVKPAGSVPALSPGVNPVRFDLEGASGDFQVRVLATKVYR